LPPTGEDHDDVTEALFHRWRGSALAGECRVHINRGYKLSDRTWLKPDVSITHSDQTVRKYLLGAPALAIEVVCDDDREWEVRERITEYFSNGALEVWLVFPNLRKTRIHKPDGSSHSFTGRFSSDLLPGVEFDLEEILGQ
jgi:Uma2 family endonuclease